MLAFDLVSDFIEFFACGSEGRADHVLGDVVQKFVKNYSHQLIIIMIMILCGIEKDLDEIMRVKI